MAKKPMLVSVEEVSRRSVIIWVDESEDEIDAVDTAEELCSEDTICLDCDDFISRSCECIRPATEADVGGRYEQYDKNGKIERPGR